MNNKYLIFYFVLLCGSIYTTECKFRSSSRSGWSGSRSRSKPHTWGSSSSSHKTHSYPSSSTGLSGSGSSSRHSYPSSSGSGLSGFGKLSGHKYPSSTGLSGSLAGLGYPSSTGLSGTGSTRGHVYPSSSTGLSGTGSSRYPGLGSIANNPSSISTPNSYKYPISSTGLSGSGSSGSHGYPSSISGLSGGTSSFPKTPSGLLGTSTGQRPSTFTIPKSADSLNNKFPSSNHGYSSNTNYRPSYSNANHASNTYTHNNGGYHYGNGGGALNNGQYNYGQSAYHIPPSHYYTAPQYVYVKEYRNSGSRFSDILTGLAVYNMARSFGHSHHDHYYYDDYYRRRYNSPSNNYHSREQPKDSAVCSLRVKEGSNVQILKVPCEIVSTFTDESKKLTSNSTNNTTMPICDVPAKESQILNPILNVNNTQANVFPSINTNATVNTIGMVMNTSFATNNTIMSNNNNLKLNTSDPFMTPYLITLPNNTSTIANNTTQNLLGILNTNNSVEGGPSFVSNGSATLAPMNEPKATTVPCIPAIDPLSVKGPPINETAMECKVEVKTKEAYFAHDVDCGVLVNYSKSPEPKNESAIIPSRSKLKSWLANPPWWLAAFIAV